MISLTKAPAIELPLPVRRFPIFTYLCLVKQMAKTADRTNKLDQLGPLAVPILSSWHPSDLPTNMSVGHSQWRARHGGRPLYMSVCECQACPKPSDVPGKGHRPTFTALIRQKP